jgi:ABC-type multidrug transport system ATPase subunit/ABC-type transporter Mla maintaining outer membrane lipid asymmetry permease subunit MlaE
MASSEIRLCDLTVTAGRRTLLSHVNASFPAAQISLVIGPSGVGKSILLKIISGLIHGRSDGIRMKGKVLFGDEPTVCGKAGVVFQSFALLDELTPLQNVDFARQAGGRNIAGRTAEEWLAELNVPTDVPTARLSGGQRQRLALARTLANDPPVILYDEPTSGLDPATARRVADLIKTTHDKHQKTSVIVTHDYLSLLPIADRVFLFDSQKKRLVELAREEWSDLGERLEPLSNQALNSGPQGETEPSTLWRSALQKINNFFEVTWDVVLCGLIGLASLIPTWRSVKWGLRFSWHYFLLVAGPTAIAYLFMAGLINGFVTTYFTFEFFPFALYTEPLLIEDLLEAIGFALYRIFCPILSCILIAARCGAAITADVGGRQYGSQIEAMATLGASPRAYLLTPIMWSFVAGVPILCFVSYYASKLASVLSFSWSHPERGPDFWDHNFHLRLIVIDQFTYFGFGWMFAKITVSGLGIAAIAYFRGRTPKLSPSDVSRSVTSTILWGTLYVLAVHYVFALFEFEHLKPPVDN